MEAHILVAEDEERLRTIIRDYFTAHGLTCALAKDGEEALERLRERDYDAVLLDVLMPNLDGFAVCRAVREGSGVPILFLTALGGEKDVLRGYALGADDYVTKPFSLAVLLAKTEALIRRSRGGGAETLACGAITLEPGRRACTVGGRLVALPPREYELLLCLMRNKGQVLRREQLLDKVWGIDFEGGDRAVDGRIKALPHSVLRVQGGILVQAAHPDTALPHNPPPVGHQLTGTQLEQGALSCSVPAHHAYVLPPVEGKGSILKQRLPAKGVGQPRDLQQTHGIACHPF